MLQLTISNNKDLLNIYLTFVIIMKRIIKQEKFHFVFFAIFQFLFILFKSLFELYYFILIINKFYIL